VKNDVNGEDYSIPERYTPEGWSLLSNGKFKAICKDGMIKKPVNMVLHSVPYTKTSYYAKVVRELELSVKLSHKNIVAILNIFSPQPTPEEFSHFFVVYEFMDHDLNYLKENRQWLEKRNNSSGAERLSFIAYQMFCGIDYLHKAGIAHRDLRPSTIMINKYCKIKIGNLGNARHFSEIAELPDSEEAPGYWAPEIYQEIKKQKAEEMKEKGDLDNFKPKIAPNLISDVWALGIILFEIVGYNSIGKRLFPDMTMLTDNAIELIISKMTELPKKVGASQFPESKHSRLLPHKGLFMLQNMTATDPKERYTARKLLSMDYVHWVRMEGDISLPPGHCITVGIDKIEFSPSDWKENLFRMIKDYERNHETGTFVPPSLLAQESQPDKSQTQKTIDTLTRRDQKQ